eukprot:591559-Pyramimonas_sp.AAC.1
MGVMEFPTVTAKVNFWKKARSALSTDENAFGKIFFRNNLTMEEREREKRLGYTKHYLTEHAEHSHQEIKIIWTKSMVVLKDGLGKERKIAWYDEEGNWHTTTTGKVVKKEVEEAMEKWRKKVRPEPETESE